MYCIVSNSYLQTDDINSQSDPFLLTCQSVKWEYKHLKTAPKCSYTPQQLWGVLNILQNIKTNVMEWWTEWTRSCKAYLSCEGSLVTDTALSAERPDGAWCSGHIKAAPWGTSNPSPHPFSPRNRDSDWARGPVLCLSSIFEATSSPKYPSCLPLASCSGHCPNASTSHLGLAKPDPTVRGAGMTCSAQSTHPWQKHNGTRTGWLADCTGYR